MTSDKREVDLVERLIADPAFRRAYLQDPGGVLTEQGFADLAAVASAQHAPLAIDGRESRSGLGGIAAAAIVALGAIELADTAEGASAVVTPENVAEPNPSGPQALPAVAPPIDPATMVGPNAGGRLHPSEYAIPDPEGAPGPTGPIHAGYDLFAAAGTPVRSPVAGTVIEMSPSRGMSGQIFGGVVKVQSADERIWVFRHVVPSELPVGTAVTPGVEIASVSSWTGGTPHVHLELWRTLEGGYRAANMDDPYVELAHLYPEGSVTLAPSDAVAAAAVVSSDPLSKGRASGVFQTVGDLSSPVATSAAAPASVVDFGPVGDYPGDGAAQPAMARWMAATAHEAGLPPELPVMASLVESGLRNLTYGDRDSVGFFQMRTGIWNTGAYAGYPENPELQMRWFIDRALAVKADRMAEGDATFGTDPATFGNWIADIERPAEQYRGRYQLRLDEARALLGSVRPEIAGTTRE